MFNREKLVNFFEENGISNSSNFTQLKNLYLIFELINNEETFKGFIEGEEGKVRNPYKNVYQMKPGKDFFKNISERARGTIEINEINKQAKLDYCKSVVMSAAIFHKMGYNFSKEEASRVETCYDILYKDIKDSNKKINRTIQSIIEMSGYESQANFPLFSYGEEIKKIMSNENPSKEESEKYRNYLKNAISMLNDNEATKNFIYDFVNSNNSYDNSAIEDIVNLICLGKINFNENMNINSSKIQYISQLVSSGIESSDEREYREEVQYSWTESQDVVEKINQYNEVIDEILEKSLKDNESGKNLARLLYSNLNDALLYNTTAFSWSQDNENIKDIINKDKTEDINRNNRTITCHTWSSAMLDLLTRAGFDAYIVGQSGHQFVLYFDENKNACIADGTNPPSNEVPNWFRAADISRNKLGLTPNNLFQILGRDEYLRENNLYFSDNGLVRASEIEEQQRNSKNKKEFNIDEFKKEDGTYDYKSIIKTIDKNPSLTKKLVETIKSGKAGNSIISALNEIIKTLVEGHEDDDLLALNCISNIVYAIKTEEDGFLKNVFETIGVKPAYSIGASHNIYKKVGDRTKFIPLIYIKEKDKTAYYIWVEPGEFVEIEKQDLIDKINSGEFHSSSNNGSRKLIEGRYIIAGIKSPKKSINEEEESIFGKKDTDDMGWQRI